MSELSIALFGAACGLVFGLIFAVAARATLKPAIAKAQGNPALDPKNQGQRLLFFATVIAPGLFAAAGALAANRLFFDRWL